MGTDKFIKLLVKHNLDIIDFMLMKKEWEGLSLSQKTKVIKGKLNNREQSV